MVYHALLLDLEAHYTVFGEGQVFFWYCEGRPSLFSYLMLILDYSTIIVLGLGSASNSNLNQASLTWLRMLQEEFVTPVWPTGFGQWSTNLHNFLSCGWNLHLPTRSHPWISMIHQNPQYLWDESTCSSFWTTLLCLLMSGMTMGPVDPFSCSIVVSVIMVIGNRWKSTHLTLVQHHPVGLRIDRRQQTGKFAPIHFAAHLGGWRPWWRYHDCFTMVHNHGMFAIVDL